jgi:hypothetical protein
MNGYTNVNTWRVMAEILGDIEFKEPVTEAMLSTIVDDQVFILKRHLMEDYARAYLAHVNYFELQKLINEELKINPNDGK